MSHQTCRLTLGCRYYNALCRFEGPHELSWTVPESGAEGKVLADKIIVATGGRPSVPSSLPGKELAITSDDLFSMPASPGETLCVGAGYIALECGGFLTNLGYPVDIAVRSVPLRTGFDRDASRVAVELMRHQGTNFLLGCSVTGLEKDAASGKIKASFEYKQVQPGQPSSKLYDTILYAIGRNADTSGLNLEVTGVELDKRGQILVDRAEGSSVPHIFALGDCCQGREHIVPELTPVAVQSGELLARRMFVPGYAQLMDYDQIATTVFTPFEIGSIGLPEHEAVDKFGAENIQVYLKEYESLELSAIHRQTASPYKEKLWDEATRRHIPGETESTDLPPNGLTKLVCLKNEHERVVGFHYVGPNAGEVTQGFAVAMRLGATKADFDATVGIHPTDAEAFTMLDITRPPAHPELWEDWVASGGCGGGKCG